MQNAPYQNPYMYPGYTPRFGTQPAMNPTPYYPPQQPAPRATITMVTSRAEVEAAQIPFDGTIPVFADFGHGVIYTKRLNINTGTADVEEYAIRQPQAQPAADFAPVGMVQALAAKMEEMEQRLQALTDSKARKFVPKKEESNE